MMPKKPDLKVSPKLVKNRDMAMSEAEKGRARPSFELFAAM